MDIKKIPYNFTPIDNNLIDHEMRFLTGGEVKHYIYTARKTIGTKVSKREESICVDEFMEYTGMSNFGTLTAVKGLEKAGFIEVDRGKKGSKQVNKITILMLDKEKYIREKLKHVKDIKIVSSEKSSSEIISHDNQDNLTRKPSDNQDNLTPLTDITDIKTAEIQRELQLSVENAQFIAEEIMTQVEAIHHEANVKFNPKSSDRDFNPIYNLFRVEKQNFEDVFAAVEFAFSDNFWRGAIKTTAGFKKNYTKLRLAMKAGSFRKSQKKVSSPSDRAVF